MVVIVRVEILVLSELIKAVKFEEVFFNGRSSCTHNNSGHLEMVIIVNVVPVASVLLRHSKVFFRPILETSV